MNLNSRAIFSSMDEVQLDVCDIRGESCFKVIWKQIPIGLLKQDKNDCWRYCKDLKGEFWSIKEYAEKDAAIDDFIKVRKELDEFRIRMIMGK